MAAKVTVGLHYSGRVRTQHGTGFINILYFIQNPHNGVAQNTRPSRMAASQHLLASPSASRATGLHGLPRDLSLTGRLSQKLVVYPPTKGLSKSDRHPASTPHGLWYSLSFLHLVIITHPFMRMAELCFTNDFYLILGVFFCVNLLVIVCLCDGMTCRCRDAASWSV